MSCMKRDARKKKKKKIKFSYHTHTHKKKNKDQSISLPDIKAYYKDIGTKAE